MCTLPLLNINMVLRNKAVLSERSLSLGVCLCGSSVKKRESKSNSRRKWGGKKIPACREVDAQERREEGEKDSENTNDADDTVWRGQHECMQTGKLLVSLIKLSAWCQLFFQCFFFFFSFAANANQRTQEVFFAEVLYSRAVILEFESMELLANFREAVLNLSLALRVLQSRSPSGLQPKRWYH